MPSRLHIYDIEKVLNWKRYELGRVHKRIFFYGAPEWTAHGERELEVGRGPSINKHGENPNLKKKNLYIKIKDGNPSIKSTRQTRA
jgi:hypothetical protein